MSWSHVGLNCRDIDTTARFYTELFGFRPAREVALGDDRILFLRQGSAYLELFAAAGQLRSGEGDGPHQAGTVRHLAFTVENVDAFLAAHRSAGEPTLGPLDFDDFVPGWRSVWLSDPDGVVVEVSQGYQDDPALTRPAGGDDDA